MKPMSGCALIGAVRALAGIQDAVILQHSVVGCHWGTLAIGMLQQPDNFRQASTVIYEENVIQGGTGLISRGLTNIVELYPDVHAVFVISGCIPNMIGDDMESAIAEWQGENPGHRVLYVPAPGYEGHESDGIERGYLSLLPLIEEQGKPGNMKSVCPADSKPTADKERIAQTGRETAVLPKVNLLGMTASDPYSVNDLQYLHRIFSGRLEIICALQECSVEEIARMGQADLNIVFGRGIKLAEQMQKQYGVPYICCEYPYGIQGMTAFLEKLGKNLPVDFAEIKRQISAQADVLVKICARYLTTLYQLPAALVGDCAHLSGMKRFIQDELGMDVMAAFDTDETDQNQLEDALKNSNAVLLMGSSYETALAEKMSLPLVRYVYPVVDEVCLTQQPLIGPEGTACLIQQIVNAAMRIRYKTDGVYGGLRKTE